MEKLRKKREDESNAYKSIDLETFKTKYLEDTIAENKRK